MRRHLILVAGVAFLAGAGVTPAAADDRAASEAVRPAPSTGGRSGAEHPRNAHPPASAHGPARTGRLGPLPRVSAGERLAMPYRCDVVRGHVRLQATGGLVLSYPVLGPRAARPVAFCAGAGVPGCPDVVVHRLALQCGSARVSWIEVAGALLAAASVKSRLEQGRLVIAAPRPAGERAEPCRANRRPVSETTTPFHLGHPVAVDCAETSDSGPEIALPAGYAPIDELGARLIGPAVAAPRSVAEQSAPATGSRTPPPVVSAAAGPSNVTPTRSDGSTRAVTPPLGAGGHAPAADAQALALRAAQAGAVERGPLPDIATESRSDLPRSDPPQNAGPRSAETAAAATSTAGQGAPSQAPPQATDTAPDMSTAAAAEAPPVAHGATDTGHEHAEAGKAAAAEVVARTVENADATGFLAAAGTAASAAAAAEMPRDPPLSGVGDGGHAERITFPAVPWPLLAALHAERPWLLPALGLALTLAASVLLAGATRGRREVSTRPAASGALLPLPQRSTTPLLAAAPQIEALCEQTMVAISALDAAPPLQEVLDGEVRLARQRLDAAVASVAGGDDGMRRASAMCRNIVRDLDRVRRIADSAVASFRSGSAQGIAPPATRAEAYDVLGINPDVGDATLKKLADALRMSWHPDHARDEADRGRREARTKQINIALDMIRSGRDAAQRGAA